ncbi:MAG: AF1514 family protein [Deltaproteobacteria bacterium]|nr:AF1514 family protein [Deltaproteobacteria bacterium]
MLNDPVRIHMGDHRLSFETAKQTADTVARKSAPSPMLLAWFDRRRQVFSPQVECCSEEKPGWLVYAESRGGSLVIDINDEEYVFVYLPEAP